MKNRCQNPNYLLFHDYGGRGISVCAEWEEYSTFKEWAIANGYTEGLSKEEQSLDRIDVNGNYCPDNCRFADRYTQANNTRKNVYIVHDGVSHTIAEWARLLNVSYNFLYSRVRTKGLPIADIMSEMQRKYSIGPEDSSGCPRHLQKHRNYISENP